MEIVHEINKTLLEMFAQPLTIIEGMDAHVEQIEVNASAYCHLWKEQCVKQEGERKDEGLCLCYDNKFNH